MSRRSKSESLFEKFCDSNQILWERIEESSATRSPDYKINLSGQDLIVEIKQFDPNGEEQEIIKRKEQGECIAFGINPGERVRKAIRKANSQLKQLSKGTIPTLLVVFDNVTPYPESRLGHTSDYCVMTAMRGVDQIPVAVPNDPKKSVVFGEVESGGKRAMRSDVNTTVSAVAAMIECADNNICLRIYHNRFAAIPVDPTVFRIENARQFRLPENSKSSLEKGWIPI
jgi:hypothetical protein